MAETALSTPTMRSGPELIEVVAPRVPAYTKRRSSGPILSLWPSHEVDEIAAVVDVLRSGRVNALQHGERCRAFERAMATSCDQPYAISLANGTLALELALRALNIGPGDEVIVTPRSFVASASCVLSCGAKPIFADVDAASQNLTASTIEAVLTPRTRAIIPVHLAGWPCAMDEIMDLAERHGIKVIEDCAQAQGARYRGRPVGSFGESAIFSFCTDKIISTGGEGGMLLLRDEATWRRAWSYKDHGKDYEVFTQPSRSTAFRWVHAGAGSNYRMTEMQAAIGLRQLTKLPRWLASRRRNAGILTERLAGFDALRLPVAPPEVGHAYYKYYVFIQPKRLRAGWSRDRILDEIVASNVPCFTGSCPEIYRESVFTDAGLSPTKPLATAERLGMTSLMFLVDHTLDEAAMEASAERIADVLSAASL